MKKIIIILSFSFFSVAISWSQVESESNIILINSNDSLRQVIGLASPENDSSGLNAQTFVSAKYSNGIANGSMIQLDFTPDYLKLSSGMYFNLTFLQINDSILTLQIDQLPVIPIKNFNLQYLDSGAISIGEIITVVYNGSEFVIINPPKQKCPSGFLQVNNRFCIEENERPAAPFFNAVTDCSNSGFEVCGYSDWIQACNTVPGLLNMTDNFEWVNTAGNSADQVKIMGMNQTGITGCNKTYTTSVNNLRAYRCCYYLKK